MAQVQQFDTRAFDRLEFPYDTIPRELNDEPRIVAGVNMYVTPGGKLAKRPGTAQVTGGGVDQECGRLVAVETLDSPPKVYLVGSFKNGAFWELKYINLDDASPAWTALTALRNSNTSVRPHELIAHRGKVYIHAYPPFLASGSIIFNPTNGSVQVDFWGLDAPTVPARVVNPASWSATTNVHAYQVRFGWKYCYAWVSRTGQVSNRSPLETNPDVNPSDTGDLNVSAGAGKCPEVVVQGHADTTRIPKINIYRTTDGGGTFYFLEQITNTGAGNITYVDKGLESGVSGGVFADPKPDSTLDYTQTAPSTVSNSAPPAGQVTEELALVNGDFEDGLANWTTAGSWATTTTDAWEGSSLRGDAIGAEISAYMILPVEVGQTLTVKFRARSTTNVASYSHIRWRTSGGTFISATAVTDVTSDTWTEYTYSYTAPATAGLAWIMFTVPSGANTGRLLVDDVRVSTTVVEKTTPLTIYAGRIWYGIGRYLYFSSQEEIREGVPEESFPAGLRGNYFLLPFTITNLAAAKDGLAVICEKTTMMVRGQDKETFVVEGLLPDLGQAAGHPRAACSLGDGAAWLTHDFRVNYYIRGNNVILSDALYEDLRSAVNNGAEIQLSRWADLSQDYLIVAAHRANDTTQSRQWVLDINRLLAQRGGPFWFTPWTIPATCFLAARVQTTPVNQRLLSFFWNGTNGGLTQVSAEHAYTLDYAWGTGGTVFSYFCDLMPVRLPAGNHVNGINIDARTPAVDHMQLERSTFAGDRDPQVFSFYDDLWENAYELKAAAVPPKRKTSRGYKTCHFTDFHEVGQRVFLRLSATAPYHAEFHSLYIAFNPVGGA